MLTRTTTLDSAVSIGLDVVFGVGRGRQVNPSCAELFDAALGVRWGWREAEEKDVSFRYLIK